MEKKKLEKAINLMNKNNFESALKEFNIIFGITDDIYTKNKLNTFIKICNEKLKNNEKSDNVDLYLKAVFNINNGLQNEAIEILNNLLKDEKENDTYLYTLSIAYMKNEDEVNASTYLKKSIDLNDKNFFHALNEECLSELAKEIKEE